MVIFKEWFQVSGYGQGGCQTTRDGLTCEWSEVAREAT
jgi:hypothetical protein